MISSEINASSGDLDGDMFQCRGVNWVVDRDILRCTGVCWGGESDICSCVSE